MEGRFVVGSLARPVSRMVTSVIGLALSTCLVACSANASSFVLDIASSVEPVQPSLQLSVKSFTGTAPVIESGGTATLVEQIMEGKHADLLVSADRASIDRLIDAGRVDGAPVALARNRLVLATPASNPGHVGGLDDLGRPNVRVVVCGATVPCGALAREALSLASITVTPITETQNVAAAVQMLESGDADAGLVYATDVLASNGNLIEIAEPRLARATTTVTGAVIRGANFSLKARKLLNLWSSPAFSGAWMSAGFQPVDAR